MEVRCALGWVSVQWSTGQTASCAFPFMALLIRLDAVYGPRRVPEATGTCISCPVRLGARSPPRRRGDRRVVARYTSTRLRPSGMLEGLVGVLLLLAAGLKFLESFHKTDFNTSWLTLEGLERVV